MSKAFKKGELATYICRWNETGTYSFRTVRVESCGAKKMTLSNEATGEMMGCHFFPGIGFDSHSVNWAMIEEQHQSTPRHAVVSTGTFKLMSEEDAQAFCLQLSAEWIDHSIKRFERILEDHKAYYGEDGYFKSISEKLATLKATKPSFIIK